MPVKKKTLFVCQECGYNAPKWMGKCPGCGAWNTMVEETAKTTAKHGLSLGLNKGEMQKPQLLSAISLAKSPRFTTGSSELDRVLGGGIIPGSMVLMVGDPGVGKSSLNLRVCSYVSQGKKVLYITGEESLQQIRMRADRIHALSDTMMVLSETNMEYINDNVTTNKPDLLVIDSIQTIFRPDIQSAPGSVSQVRECAVELLRIAKTNGVAVFIIGHVTKDGTLAGPRVLEHIVDTVLYFEGERNAQFRILRAIKNRFGSTNEIGLFEMRDIGLIDVPDASKLFLSETILDSGIIITPTVEGTRPLLVEIQALVTATPYIPPRRTSDSVDIKKIQLLLAVLEKRVNLSMGACDVYVKIAGGIKIDEPACDLALCIALTSSFTNKIVKPKTIVFGEVGLSGEIRAVNSADIRVKEACKLGFTNVIVPQKNLMTIGKIPHVAIYGVKNIKEALKIVFQ
ncbi:DNA repair protein RadA [Pectinatus sottacetonis]|uniref:DNA repair protein RadA n=1 Tax=Pectinatus sottacetonis TaxID=1002795 RepID=UPI0018C481FD|nr:DNA repair protein RadA [Pectinatus sottacetonis]